MSTAIGDILKQIVRKYGLESAMHKERMPTYWAEVVGVRIARISNVRSFESGVLTIRVMEAPWRSELTLRREELRTQLNARIGEDLIKEIVVR
jgi:predicted nucleic acid-binding Zn ribbon protein